MNNIEWLKSNTTTIDAAAHAEKMRILDALTEKAAKLEAVVKACEPIMEKLELRDKRDAETGSYLWNDAHIELHQVHWRNIQAAVKAAGGSDDNN